MARDRKFDRCSALPIYRVPLTSTGRGRLPTVYGGRFDAWSFIPTCECLWFAGFRDEVLRAIGQRYLPVYRIADGEFQALLGRRVRWRSDRSWRDCIAVALERVGLFHRTRRTSWGEHYDRSARGALLRKLTSDVTTIAGFGHLAVLLSDNGFGLAHEYRRPFCAFVASHAIPFGPRNYVPFHFVCELLSGPGSDALVRDRRILVVTGLRGKDTASIEETLRSVGAATVQFLGVSSNHAMLDTLDISSVCRPVDICFVAAGVGAANVLVQLRDLGTVALDIGGYIHCLEDRNVVSHAVFRAPSISD